MQARERGRAAVGLEVGRPSLHLSCIDRKEWCTFFGKIMRFPIGYFHSDCVRLYSIGNKEFSKVVALTYIDRERKDICDAEIMRFLIEYMSNNVNSRGRKK